MPLYLLGFNHFLNTGAPVLLLFPFAFRAPILIQYVTRQSFGGWPRAAAAPPGRGWPGSWLRSQCTARPMGEITNKRERAPCVERETGGSMAGTGNDDFFNGHAQDVEAQPVQKKKNIFKRIQETDTKTVTTYLRYANLCNAMCIITAGVVTLATLGSFNLTTMFIGLYIA